MKTFLVMFCATMHSCVWAQTYTQPNTAGYGRINAYSAASADVNGCIFQPAVLPKIKTAEISIYAGQQFGMTGMRTCYGAVAVPVSFGCIGFFVSRFGGAQSNQTNATLAYGVPVSKSITAGICFSHIQLHQAGGYGKAAAVTGGAGLQVQLTQKISAGFNVYNPFSASWSKSSGAKIPAQYSFGAGYDISEKLFAGAVLVKEEDQAVYLQAGIQFCAYKKVFIRAGVTVNAPGYYAAAGVLLKGLRLDVVVDHHPQLGFSPGLIMVYRFKKKPPG